MRASGGAVSEHFDVLIVGAGLSGIDAAYRLQERCPDKGYAIFEGRDAMGGTWDLFRYPGVRSDSDIYTLGFPFRPWRGDRAIVDGASIRAYVEETAREFGISERIHFGHRVIRADWSSADARWTVEAEADGAVRRFTCGFLYLCTGYYDYDRGFRPRWPGEEAFAGRIVHPQFWPDDLDHDGRRVAVIGSGATAVTLVPAMAAQAAHVAMVQRSPTYVVSRPARDPLAARAARWLPAPLAEKLVRWKNVLLGLGFFGFARHRPETVRRLILQGVRKELGPDYPIERDFAPSYRPWDQRLCLVPDGDLFAAIRSGRAAVVTGEIDSFTRNGLRMRSGEEIEADIVVTATGLVVKLFGGMTLAVNGVPVDPADRLVYKGMMLSDVPNLALAFGYTNASWTLKCDLTARTVCRLLKHMDRHGHAACTPRLRDPGAPRRPLLDFTSGYVRRAAAILPAQGQRAPWRVHQNYLLDLAAMRLRPVADEAMVFETRAAAPPES
ncbi:NAD(P)/FAD-dependent oxidoreductase [Sphingomonas parva]|uniref:NAD(P)/FAD-dependent oxidoreductase n=1 Tax=Sphingomonas parva TaxID=2555898 RepID=A0A4Y8ZVR6_9SPHN|nr:NAD(P)/FAD-dependent oxidoreductase [Sphingomonas parva]TFI58526.1 NAD(P)/FAD-dependent oxidoreductase [Sphingomonas parva]